MRPGARLRLLLLALCGAAAAASPARAAAGPDPFAAAPALGLPSGTRQAFEDIGFRFDARGRGLSPGGRPLTADAYRKWLEPYDYVSHPLSEQERSDLVLSGCRLDGASRHVLCLPDKKPLDRLDMARRLGGSMGERSNALERLGVILQDAGSGAALPADARAKIEALDQADPGAIPAALRSELLAPKAAALARARSDWQSAYLDSTRFWDGRIPLKDQLDTAVPLPKDWRPQADPKFFDDGEKKVSALLQRAAAKRIARFPTGARLLAHFEDARGTLDLPAIHVLPIASDMAGNYQGGQIAVSRGDLLDSLSGGDAARRAALARRLKTSRELAAYLAAHPALVDRYLAQNEGTLVHELTHAWQNRRDRVWGEQARGNVPGGDWAEDEHEAFLTEMLFLNDKLKADPLDKNVDEDSLRRYTQLALDFDRWRDEITQEYFEDFPASASSVETAREIQAERASAARRLMGESLYKLVYEGAKLVGLELGSQTIDAFSAGYSARMSAFLKNEYPAFRRQASGVLARRRLAAALARKPGQERQILLGEAADFAKTAQDPALSARIEAARKAAGSALHAG